MENQNINVNEVEFEGGANSTEQIKTYTQEEVNELLKGYKSQEEVNNIVNKRLAREKKDIEARIEAEKREAERLATMSAEEKAKHELEKRIAELEAREREIARKELENETSRQLKDLGISYLFTVISAISIFSKTYKEDNYKINTEEITY